MWRVFDNMPQERITGWLALADGGGELSVHPDTLPGVLAAIRVARRRHGYVVPIGTDDMPRIRPIFDFRKD